MASVAAEKAVAREDDRIKVGDLRLMTSQRFDWHEGTFHGYKRGQIGKLLLLNIVLCAFFFFTPIILYNQGIITGPYPLFDKELPKTFDPKLEIIRWVIFGAIGYTGFVTIDLLAIGCLYSAYLFYRIRRREAPQRVQRGFDHMIFVYKYVAYTVASLALFLASFWLFPLTKEEQAMAVFNFDDLISPKKPGKDSADAASGMAFTQYFKQYKTGHSFQFFVNRTAASMFVFCLLVLVEKLFIQRISSTFYKRAFGHRIDDNRFTLKITKRLASAIVQSHPEYSSLEIHKLVFKGLCPSHRETISKSDMIVYIPESDAERYFSLVDKEATGDMNSEQFERAISGAYAEREALRQSMLDQDNVIGKLDQLFLGFVWLLVGLIWMVVFQISVGTILAVLASIGGFLTLVATGTAKTAFESIVFVIFTHPFDVGDQVIIARDVYYVKELGLWTTTFIGPHNRVTYISNSKLRNEMIVNSRRSPFQSEVVRFNVLPSVPTDKLRLLEGKLRTFLQKNSKDYLPKLDIGGYVIKSKDVMELTVPVFHRGNFQDEGLKDRRTRNFVLYLKDAIAECGVALSPPEEVILRKLA